MKGRNFMFIQRATMSAIAAGAIGLSAGSAEAATITLTPDATIVDYQFTAGSFASSDPSTNWDTGNLSIGSGLTTADTTTVAGTISQTNSDYATGSGSFPTGSISASKDANNYYQFTVTPDVDTTIDFTNFSFDAARTNTSQAYNLQAVLFWDVDNYTTAIATADPYTSLNPPSVSRSVPIDVGPVSTPTTFRMVLVTNGTSGARSTFDNIVLQGDVTVIPEPGSLALLGLGGLLIARRRRAS